MEVGLILVGAGIAALIQHLVWREPRLPKICSACGGTGRQPAVEKVQAENLTGQHLRSMLLAAQGICLACEGRGEFAR